MHGGRKEPDLFLEVKTEMATVFQAKGREGWMGEISLDDGIRSPLCRKVRRKQI